MLLLLDIGPAPAAPLEFVRTFGGDLDPNVAVRHGLPNSGPVLRVAIGIRDGDGAA